MREDITVFKDEIMGKLQNVQDDMTVYKGWRDMMEDHETRITKLEEKQSN